MVRAHRLRVPLTQEELAELAGVSLRAVQRIESGRTRPRPATVRLLADGLGLHGPQREAFVWSLLGRA